MAVYIVRKKGGSGKKQITIVKNPVLKQERIEEHKGEPGEYVFYGVYNGQRVNLPSKANKIICVEQVFRAQNLKEPFDWRNSYEAVLTRRGYVLIGSDVLRGIETDLNEYPIRWYSSIDAAEEDYRIFGKPKTARKQAEEEQKELSHKMASLEKARKILEENA